MAKTTQKRHSCEEPGCEKSYDLKSDLTRHVNSAHRGVKFPCQQPNCGLSFTTKSYLDKHERIVHVQRACLCEHPGCGKECSGKRDLGRHIASEHPRPRPPPRKNFRCEKPGCDKAYAYRNLLKDHVDFVHLGIIIPCTFSDCGKTFSSRSNRQKHIKAQHHGVRHICSECGGIFTYQGNLKKHENEQHRGQRKVFACDWHDCDKSYSRKDHLEQHINSVHLGITYACDHPECEATSTNRWNLKRHMDSVHHGKTFPCQYINCAHIYTDLSNLQFHIRSVHLGMVFLCEWPNCGKPYVTKSGLQVHINGIHLEELIVCEDCQVTFTDPSSANKHFGSFHSDRTFHCKYREELGCMEEFPTVYMANYHSSSHFPMICQVDRCLAHLQERMMSPGYARAHYRVHVVEGHCHDGEKTPLTVHRGSIEDLSGDEDNASLTEHSAIEVRADPQEYEILNGESVIDTLTRPPKCHDHLREVHRSQNPNYQCRYLKCPGPGVVVDGIVLGEDVCPHNTIISPETGLFMRDHGRIIMRIRCGPCQGRKNLNIILVKYELEAEPGQKSCKTCFKPLWEGSKYCKEHMRSWAPEALCAESINELKALFLKAASEQWSPTGDPMAGILERVELDGNAKSDLLQIDLEFSTRSRQVYQIAISDFNGDKKLDCAPVYGDGIVTDLSPSSSLPPVEGLLGNTPYQVMAWEKKMVKRYDFATDGAFGAKKVADKLGEIVSEKTIFVAWGTWAFDVAHVREWLNKEHVTHNLPQDEQVCLLLLEFRENLKQRIGRECFRGHSFPLSLPVLFALLFEGHDLVGMNHDALVDAKQLSLLLRLFLDLCNVPEERVIFKGTFPIRVPGMNAQIDNYFQPENKRKRGSEEEGANQRARLE